MPTDDGDRYVTMSITSLGPSTLPKSDPKVFAVKNTNDISDIFGARPGPKYPVYTNKPTFTPADVEGAAPKQLIRGRNTRDNSLYIDDIEGTRITIKDRMMKTNRHVNPLEPEYPLPKFTAIPVPEPKFLRDTIDVSDIEGTKPKVKKEFATRDILSVDDIAGTKPGLTTL